MPSIRTATEQDAEGLATLLRELALFCALEGQPAEAVAQGVQAQLKASLASPSHTIIVAEQGAEGDAQQGCSQGPKLVGYACRALAPSPLSPWPGWLPLTAFRRSGRAGSRDR